MSWLVLLCYILVATTSISGVEYIARTTDTVWEALVKGIPLVLISQYCLYYIFSTGPSVMMAWVIFTIAMSLTRFVNSAVILREDLNFYWIAVGLASMFIAALCIKQAHN